MSNDNLPQTPWTLGEYWPPINNQPDAEAKRLIDLADERLSGLIMHRRTLTVAECLALWAPRD